jgi:high-affinity iron transporter
VLTNYLIGLREGLEAALVVGILVAYLVRTGHREKVRWVWLGVAAAVVLALGFGALLTFSSAHLPENAEPLFAGTLSLVAVAFVTWMVFWMKRAARDIRGELHGRLEQALDVGAWALAAVAFVAVAREGLETALFLWASINGSEETEPSFAGAALGLATAVLLGWLLYRGALRLNLASFFRWTGAALIVVAAGVLAYAVHDLQEGGVLPGEDNLAFDISATMPEDSFVGTLVKGIFNIAPTMTVLSVIAWFAYLVPTMWLYLRAPRAAAPAPAPASSAAAEIG